MEKISIAFTTDVEEDSAGCPVIHLGDDSSCCQVHSHMPYKAHTPYVAYLKFLPLLMSAISIIVAQLALTRIYIEMGDEG